MTETITMELGSEDGTPVQEVVQRILDHFETGLTAVFDEDPRFLILPYRLTHDNPGAAVDELLRVIAYEAGLSGDHVLCRPIGDRLGGVRMRWTCEPEDLDG